MTVLLDSEGIVDLAQTRIEAICLRGFSACVFFPNTVSGMNLAGKYLQQSSNTWPAVAVES